MDLKKAKPIVERAYNDSAGVTAAFNRNVLLHVNALCGSDFDPSRFEHSAFYNSDAGRIEMHLRSVASQTVTLRAVPEGPLAIHLDRGELIGTEHSYKYHIAEFRDLVTAAGFVSRHTWVDDRRWFSVHAFDVNRH